VHDLWVDEDTMGQNLTTRVSVLMQSLYSYCLRPFWSDTLRPSYNPCGFAYRLTLCSEPEPADVLSTIALHQASFL